MHTCFCTQYCNEYICVYTFAFLGSISQLVSDVESALAKNFNQARADALADVFKDLYTLQQMAQKVGTQIFQGQGIQGEYLPCVMIELRCPQML